MLTVKELMRKLRGIDPNTEVYFSVSGVALVPVMSIGQDDEKVILSNTRDIKIYNHATGIVENWLEEGERIPRINQNNLRRGR